MMGHPEDKPVYFIGIELGHKIDIARYNGYSPSHAEVAELVDALASGASGQ